MQERHRDAEAARAFESVIALRPEDDEARERLAGLYFAQGKWASAESHYRDVALRHPERTSDRIQLGLTMEKQTHWDEAERLFKQLLVEQPASVLAARRLAELYDLTARPDLAAKVRETFDPSAKRRLRELKKSKR